MLSFIFALLTTLTKIWCPKKVSDQHQNKLSGIMLISGCTKKLSVRIRISKSKSLGTHHNSYPEMSNDCVWFWGSVEISGSVHLYRENLSNSCVSPIQSKFEIM